VADPQQVTHLWLAPGAGARLRWPSAGGYFLEAAAALIAPLVRDRYYIAPSTTAFEVQPLNLRAGVSVGLTIW
jgi:hypothetical protein